MTVGGGSVYFSPVKHFVARGKSQKSPRETWKLPGKLGFQKNAHETCKVARGKFSQKLPVKLESSLW